jgi:DNA-binding transcriptional ArsR family regulator
MAGLVTERRRGRENRYRLRREPLDDVRRWLGTLDEFWSQGLSRLREHLETNP